MLNSPKHIQDIDGFIFFSPKTQGHVGKPVKVHTSLFVDFMLSVDPNTADGQTVIRDLESLRTLAKVDVGGIREPMPGRNDGVRHQQRLRTVHKTLNSMAVQMGLKRERPFLTKNVRAYYHIHQGKGDQYPTVYINEIQIRAKEAEYEGGFYELSAGRRGTSNNLRKMENCRLDQRSVYVSGASESPTDSMKNAAKVLNTPDPTLFYCPTEVRESLTAYKSNRFNGASKKLIDDLAATLQKNSTGSVKWVVDSEGAALLSHALTKINTPLEKHRFEFVNAIGDIPALLDNLKRLKAKTDGQFMSIDYSNKLSAMGSMLSHVKNKRAILERLADMPASSSKITIQNQANALLRATMIANLSTPINNKTLANLASLPAKLRNSKKTFVEILQGKA